MRAKAKRGFGGSVGPEKRGAEKGKGRGPDGGRGETGWGIKTKKFAPFLCPYSPFPRASLFFLPFTPPPAGSQSSLPRRQGLLLFGGVLPPFGGQGGIRLFWGKRRRDSDLLGGAPSEIKRALFFSPLMGWFAIFFLFLWMFGVPPSPDGAYPCGDDIGLPRIAGKIYEIAHLLNFGGSSRRSVAPSVVGGSTSGVGGC